MWMAIGLVAAIGAAGDSTGRPDACAELARAAAAAPDVAADVRSSVAVHNGVVRWAADRPLRVWIAPRPIAEAPDRRPDSEWRRAVLDGVTGWAGVVDGLAVAVARDSAAADVRVTWAPLLVLPAAGGAESALAARAAGRTVLVPDDGGRAVSAAIVLAMRAPDGTPYSRRDVRAVAQHEFGHALGLAHHASPASVMAPLVGAERLADGDRAALRLLYALPVGARCQAPMSAPLAP
jgi:predicted Zn-dependent protease